MRKGSAGISNFTIVLIVIILVAAIAVAAKFGGPYQTKWKFEDFMEESLARLAALGEDGVLADLEKYCEKEKIPCDPWEQCHIYGEPGKPGRIVCVYMVEIRFPFMKEPYQHKMTAVGKRTRIPLITH